VSYLIAYSLSGWGESTPLDLPVPLR
jgi:hypothetical protein